MIFRSNFFRRLSDDESVGSTKQSKSSRAGRTRQRLSRRASFRRLLERDLRFEPLEARRVLAALGGMHDLVGNDLAGIYNEYLSRSTNVDSNGPGVTFVSERANDFLFDGSSVFVEVRTTGEFDTMLGTLQTAGFRTLNQSREHAAVDGFVPIGVLGIVGADPSIYVFPVWQDGVNAQGSEGNEAEQTLLADFAKTIFASNGTGVTVGVISDTANSVAGGLADSIATGDLPAGVTTVVPDVSPGIDEGRAMMELVFDIAEGAALQFASGQPFSDLAIGTAIDALRLAGSDIIVDDLISIRNQPWFQDGIASQAVTAAFNAGIPYFSSAGNRGTGGFETPTNFSNTTVFGVTGDFQDFNLGGGTDYTHTISLSPGNNRIYFQYDQPLGGVTSDLEIRVYDMGGTLIDEGLDFNTSTQRPWENVSVFNPGPGLMNVQLTVELFSGPAPTRFKWINIGGNPNGPVEHVGQPGTFVTGHEPGHSGSANAIAVGAAFFSTPTTPQGFTSVGPTTRSLTPGGTPMALQVIQNPNITAHDGVSTSVPGFNSFFGTSAAAPNAAAIAALMLQVNPSLTPTQVANILASTATDIGAPGFDVVTGAGVVNGVRAVLAANNGVLELNGTAGNDDIEIQVNAGNNTLLDVIYDSVTLGQIPLVDITSIEVNGLGGSDTLRVDFANGSPVPVGGIVYVAGESAGDNDSLEIIGYNVGTVTATHTGPEAGTVAIGGAALISFSETEPLLLGGTAANLIINLPAGGNPDAVLGDDLGGVAGVSEIRGSTFEDTTFTNPTTSLTVNAFAGADTITMLALDAAYAATTNINTGGGIDQVRIAATSANTTTNVDTEFGFPGDLLIVGAAPDSGGAIATTFAQFNTGQGTLDFLGANSIINYDDGGGIGELYVDDSADATADNVTITSSSITGASAAAINYVGARINIVQFAAGTASDTLNITSTGADDFSNGRTTVFGNAGDDVFVIGADMLSGRNTLNGDGGNDTFNVILPAGATVGQNAVAYSAFVELIINGGAPANDNGNRDRVNINLAAGDATLRNVGINYSTTGGTAGITGLGAGTFTVNTTETVVYTGGTDNDDILTVTGSTNGNEVLSVTPISATEANVFLNGNPMLTVPPGTANNNDPGVAGGAAGPDLSLRGLAQATGLTINGGGGASDRIVVNAPTETGTGVGFAGNPAAGLNSTVRAANAAFDNITLNQNFVAITNFSAGGVGTALVQTNIGTGFGTIGGQATVTVNTGDEPGVRPAAFGAGNGAGLVADDVTATLSTLFRFQVNAGLPLPPGATPLAGDRLNLLTPGDVNIFSDANDSPNVSISSDFGGTPTQPITSNNIELLLVTSGSGVVNILGDNNNTVAQNDAIVILGQDVDQGLPGGDLFGDNEFQLLIGGDNTQSLLNRAPISVRNVLELNISSFDGDDDIVIDPFANTTTGWEVVTNVDSGAGDDDITYGNVIRNVFVDNVPDGSQAAMSENVTVTPTLIPGAGEIAVPGVATIHFQNTEDLSFLLNDGSAGDTDTLTIRGTDNNLSDTFTIRPDAAGNDAEPLVNLATGPALTQLLQIENIALVQPGGAQVFITAIDFEGLGGSDTFNLLPSANGTILNIDGGNPTFNPLSGDVIVIAAPADPTNQVALQAGATNDSGTIVSTLAGTLRAAVNFSQVEGITIDNAGASTIVGTNGDNDITVVGTAADAFTATVDGGPTVQFNAVSSLEIDALAGDDDIDLTVGPLAITSITVNGGDPPASDTLVIVGTTGVDAVVFTPTSPDSGSLTGLATPVTFATIEHVVYSANDNTGLDNVTMNGTVTNDTFDFDADLLQGSFRAGNSPDFDTLLSGRITVNGGASGVDVVNLTGSAGVDVVTSAANAITIATPGTLAIITLGGGIDAVTLSTLAGDDNINLSGVLAPITTTVFGGEGDDTIIGSPQADLIYGGDGDDILIGGAGDDVIYGEAGNDRFGDPAVADPAANDTGNDQFFGGDGSDTLVWDPGDGSDLFEGGDGADVMIFNGSGGAETFTFNAVGARLEFLRSLGAIDMDLADVEQVNLNAGGGSDNVVVNDLFGTGVQSVSLNLGTDGSTDAVTVNARTTDDSLMLTSPAAGQLLLNGLTYTVGLSTTEPTDLLTINGNAGDDQITAAPGSEAVMTITMNGGQGDDTLTGNVPFINGNDGNDLLVGGIGNQTFDGGAGDDTFVGNGGTDNVGGGAGSSVGDTILLAGTSGADTFSLSLSPTGQLLATINGLTTTYGNFLGGPIATSGIEQILVQGFAGNDTLTVDSTNGAIPIPINYEGGDNADRLTLTGGVATSNTYQVGPGVADGTSTMAIGGVTQVVRFSNLEPVLDLVEGPLTVNGTNADNAINYTQGGEATGLVSVDGFETIEFSNKTTLTINALAGSDTINLNNPNPPTGLTSIIVNGGDPTASDILVVNGTGNADTITYRPTGLDSGVVTVAGLPVVTFGGTEHLTINGLGGGDSLTIDTSLIDGTQVLTPGSTFDSGRVDFRVSGFVTSNAVALDFLGLDVGGSLTFTDIGRFDNLIYRGTDTDDTFVVTSGGQVLRNGQLPVNTPSIITLTLAGLAGNDNFTISGDHNLTSIVVEGGSPADGDVLNFIGSGVGQVTTDFASATVSEAGFGPVRYTGLGRIHLDAGGLGVAFVGTDEDDDVTATVLSAGSGTVQIGATAQQGGQAQQPPTAPLVHYMNTAGNAVDIDLGAGQDTLIVVGNALPQAFLVDGIGQSVSIDDNDNGFNDGIVTYLNAESLAVYGLEGSDTFTVTGGPIPIFIDGADPIGAIPGDTLILLNAFAFFAGPENDEGGFLTLGGPEGIVSFDHIESIIVAPVDTDDCPFVIFGTNGDDDITVIARDGSTHAGADGVQDFTVSINSGIEMLFLNQPALVIEALAGDDDIVVRGPAPNQAAWGMEFTIIGGPASAVTGDQGDVLAVETAGLVDVVYTPTGSDTGLLAITDANGLVANITIQNTPYIPGPACPPLPPPLIGGNGGIETLIYDGEGFGDSLTILGTLMADTIVHSPGAGIDEGSVRVNALLALQYQNLGLGELIVDGAGGDDTLVVDGTGLSDSFTVAANTGAVTLANSNGTRLAIGQLNLEALVLAGLEGDDTFTIAAPQPYASITVNGGGPGASDVLTISGAVGTDEAFIVNPGFNPGTGAVLVDALAVPFTGVEHLLLRGNGGDNDSLVVNDDRADNVWTVNAGPISGDRIQVDQRESIDFEGFAAVTLVNGFGSDQFIIHPTHLIGTDALTVVANGEVRDDVVTIIATEADDVVTSTADTITIDGAVPITIGNSGAGFAEVQLIALGGDDHVTLSLELPGVRKFVDGGAGNDFIDLSGTLDAVIFGGDGDDFIIGSPIADFIDGGRGNDIIFGGGGNDVIYGGEGNDILIGEAGADQMFGGDGDDTFIWNPGDGSDLIEGGTGNNRLQFAGGAGVDSFVLSSVGTRLRLSRQPGNVVMDVANVQLVDTNESLSFSGLLSGAQEVPPVATAASGRSFLTYNSAANTFDIDLFIQGITLADLVGAHIHVGAAGINGPVIFDLGTAGWYLDGGGLRRRISGATFPEANIADLLAGNTYVNIHTVANPAGEIRAQLNPLAAGQGLGGADTFEVSDLHQTDVRVINLGLGINNGGLVDVAADNVRVHGRTTDDHLLITSRSNPAGAGFADLVNVAGLRYDVNLSNAIAADGDRLTVLGNEGDDFIHAVFGVEDRILITLDGGAGNDHLIANGTLIGGAGDDLLVGGPGDNLFFGGDGNDTFIGGGGNDTYDGGAGFDTILVEGTPAADLIDVFQSADNALTYSVNGVAQNETLVVGTVEEVRVEAGAGADLIRVRTADALFNQVATALRMTVNGGTATGAGDRLVVIDDGTDDLTLYRKSFVATDGTVEVGPGNLQPFLVVFSGIERVQFLDENGVTINQDAAAGPRLAVFQPDPYEHNDDRLVATHLGAAQTINLVANIDPGPILDPFADGQDIPGDQDWYRFVAEITGTLDLQVYFTQIGPLASERPGLPAGGNLDIEVLDAAGNVIAGFGVNDATDNERRRIPAVAGQTYYLRVIGNNDAINAYNVTVLNVAPPVPFDIELQDTPVGDPPPANSDTGRSQFDNVTRDNTPTIFLRLDDGSFRFDVQGNDPGAGGFPNNPPISTIAIPFQTLQQPGYRVAIFDEGPTPGQPATNPQIPVGFAEEVAGSPGLYRFTFPVALSDGSHFISARVQMIDPSAPQQTGFGARSESLEIIVDTVPPPVHFGLPAVANDGLHPDSDSGVEGNPGTFTDRITNDTTPSFWGTAEANSIVRAYIDVNGNGIVDNADILIGFTVALPLDGTNQFPAGRWELTSTVDMNSTQARNLAGGLSPLPEDGLRRILVTAEDVAGNVSAADTLNIFIDTQGPQVTNVFITGRPDFNLFLGKLTVPGTIAPTPLVNSLSIRVQDLPARIAEFLYTALDQGVAENPGHYLLRGDFSGIIPIQSVQFISDPLVNGQPATGTIVLEFVEPLPDDRFTLTLSDSLVDPAGNALDGETNTLEPIANPLFPSGDGQPGGDFSVRFTVDSRPELGVWAAGSVWVDTNGNFTFDPGNPDFVNRDITYVMGFTSDHIFAGNFRDAGPDGIAGTADDGAADGFDKLAAYGRVAGQFRWLIDTDNDGVSDPPRGIVDPASINGLPVSGNFNPAIPGDQVGLFDGTSWHFDTTGNYNVNEVVTIPGMVGYPITGDFNGDGLVDLGTWADDTFHISLAGTPGGVGSLGWSTTLISFRFGFIGVRERPVAADMDQDGFTDVGLWVPDRSGVNPSGGGEWYFLISGGDSVLNRIVNDGAGAPFIPFIPVPFGDDLYREFGSEFALPIVGNFDPPPGRGEANVVGEAPNQYDVDGNGAVEPLDALLVLNFLARQANADGSPAHLDDSPVFPDVNRDGIITPLDALLVLNDIRQSATESLASGEGESAIRWSGSFAPAPPQLAVEESEPEFEFAPSDLESLADAWQADSAWEDLVDRLAESTQSGNPDGLLFGASTEEVSDHEASVDNALLDFQY